MDISLLNCLDVLNAAFVGAIVTAFFCGAAVVLGLPRGRTVAAAAALIATPATLFAAPQGTSFAPHANAEVHDYDADIRKSSALTALAEQHPDFRLRFIHIMETARRGTIDRKTAVLATEDLLETYLSPYFARTSDAAMMAYQGTWIVFLTQAHVVAPEACTAFLHGEAPFPIYALPNGLAEDIDFMTKQVMDHAIATPQKEPSSKWVSQTLEHLLGGRRNLNALFTAMPDFSCLDYVRMLRVAEHELPGPEYYRLLRGLIAAAYRQHTRES